MHIYFKKYGNEFKRGQLMLPPEEYAPVMSTIRSRYPSGRKGHRRKTKAVYHGDFFYVVYITRDNEYKIRGKMSIEEDHDLISFMEDFLGI